MTNELFLCDFMNYMKTCENKEFDLAIVDSPYSWNSGNAFKSRLKKYGDLNYNNEKPKKEYFDELFRISKNQIIWGGNYFIDFLYSTKCIITWWKHQPVKTYAQTEIAWTSFNIHSNIFDYKYYGNINSDKNRIHPNQKPVALYKWCLKNYASPGMKLFDSHSGSGSFRIAAYDLGFDLISCEKDKIYFESNNNRFNDYMKLKKQNIDLFSDKEIQNLIFYEGKE